MAAPLQMAPAICKIYMRLGVVKAEQNTTPTKHNFPEYP